jgi:hypothetical protein
MIGHPGTRTCHWVLLCRHDSRNIVPAAQFGEVLHLEWRPTRRAIDAGELLTTEMQAADLNLAPRQPWLLRADRHGQSLADVLSSYSNGFEFGSIRINILTPKSFRHDRLDFGAYYLRHGNEGVLLG